MKLAVAVEEEGFSRPWSFCILEMLSIGSKSRSAGRVTVAQHGFSTGMSFRFSQLNGAEPVLGKLAASAQVPSGTADAGFRAKASSTGRCMRILLVATPMGRKRLSVVP